MAGQPSPTGQLNQLGIRPASIVSSPRSTIGINPAGTSPVGKNDHDVPVPTASMSYLDEIGAASDVEIIQGPHIDTVVPADVNRFLSDVTTLDGKKVFAKD